MTKHDSNKNNWSQIVTLNENRINENSDTTIHKIKNL